MNLFQELQLQIWQHQKTVWNLKQKDREDAEITLGLNGETEYDVFVAGKSIGQMKTNLGGKLTLSD